MDPEQTRAALVRWADDDPNVGLLLLSGSQVRGDAHPLSDLDVEVYAQEPGRLLDDTAWYEQFGDVLVVEALDNPEFVPTRLVYYVGGKIDFAVGGVADLARERTAPFAVLIDKDGLADGLRLVPEPAGAEVAAEVATAVQWFWAAALMCAKAVVREEPWLAQGRLADARGELLRVVTWDHTVRYGWDYDTAFGGKRLTGWADPDVTAALAATFAAFGCADVERSLLAATELFVPLAARVAQAVGLEPFDHGKVEAEVRFTLSLSGASARVSL